MMTISRGSARARARQPFVHGLTFASCYVYSPCGSNLASQRSRVLRALLKASDPPLLCKTAERVRQQVLEASPLTGFFSPDSVLVPIPASAPRGEPGTSATELLAAALLREGLGHSVWAGLQRSRRVLKSATAMPGSRPTVAAHYESFAANGCECCARQVMLVDDIVTKGRTLLAAAARLQEALPQAQIRAFALVRTMGLVAGVERLLDPCVGEIRWRHGDAVRMP